MFSCCSSELEERATCFLCVQTPVQSESVLLGAHNTTSVFVRTLSHDGAPCPILCLEGATREQFPELVHDVPLTLLPPVRSVHSNSASPSNPYLFCGPVCATNYTSASISSYFIWTTGKGVHRSYCKHCNSNQQQFPISPPLSRSNGKALSRLLSSKRGKKNL